jgi:proteasome beta subunit
MEYKKLETGTTNVGIVCKDGVILAADKRVTLGGRIISSKNFEKFSELNDNSAVVFSGSVSDVQLTLKIIKAQLKLEEYRRGKKLTGKSTSSLLSNMVYGNLRRYFPGITGFVLANNTNGKFSLYSIGVDGSIVEYNDYTTDGSGMMFAIGVLESNYDKNINVKEGIELAKKAVTASMERDAASGNGIDILAITKDGIEKTSITR